MCPNQGGKHPESKIPIHASSKEVEPEEDLDEQIRMENLKKLSMGKVRTTKSYLLNHNSSVTERT